MIEFCPKCKTMLKVRKDPRLTYLACDHCGYAKKLETPVMREKVTHHQKVDIVTDEIHPLAVTDHTCPKCGYEKAQMISKGIWYSDEDEVIEYVCGRCGYHEKDPDQKIT